MADEIVIYGPNARLNITVNGQNGDYPDLVSYDAADGDIKQIATEAVRTGYIPGIAAAEVNFLDFVVDRFPANNELPPRLMLRPKTPFGA
jgi:adenosine/AMP kinase